MELLNTTTPFLGSTPIESFYVGNKKVYGRNILLGSKQYKFEEFSVKSPVLSDSRSINLDQLKGMVGSRISMSFSLELINAKTVGNIGFSFTITYADNTNQKVSCFYNTGIGNAYKGSFTSYQYIATKEIKSITGYGWAVNITADYVKMTEPKMEYYSKTDYTIAPEEI